MKRLLLFSIFLLLSPSLFSQESLDYYYPEVDGVTFDESIPTPEEVLGFQVGEWHVRPDLLVNYMYAVAEASDRVTIQEYARTYEQRPNVILTITSPENQANIDQIRKEHVQLTDPATSGDLDPASMPIIFQMSYSVHGNEPSGSNASLAVVYYLAAAQGPEIDEWLQNAVILIDPSINPDGLGRFAHWANMHKSTGGNLVTDPNSREYNEVWPRGRTNHYWFDLNRDWMLVQHPESKGRIEMFHKWKPTVLTDHHEMGTNSTFFFQPGVQSRTHPLTPSSNQTLTAEIAEYHADELDNIQSLYYSKEGFDDYYYGKGSTYPDVQGAIGILFEQASSRGHAQESIHGVLTFPFTVRNHVTASFSTIKAAIGLREELLEHQRTFYKNAKQEAEKASIKAYVFGETDDQARTFHLAEMLSRHQIEVYQLNKDLKANGETFKAGKAYVVPTNQPQYKLLTAMMEVRNTFTDSLFYDVSAWTMPYAFNLPYAELSGRQFNSNLLGDAFNGSWNPAGKLVGGMARYAYAFEWDEYYAPRALYRLQDAGIKTKVASKTFSSVTADGNKAFDYGTILIPMGIQSDQEKVHRIIKTITEEDGITVYNLSTGFSSAGIDLGSSSFENLEKPSVAIIGGSGTNSSEVGEAWHLMDTRYHMPLSIIDKSDLSGADLDRYNVLVMPGYYYGDMSESTVNNIKSWVRNGGVLVAYKQGLNWAKQQGLADIEYVSAESDEDEAVTRPYVMQRNDRGAQVIGGAIFNTKLDLTHPMAYGFNDDDLTVFRNSNTFIKMGENPYSTPVYYTDEPLASGYISDENIELLANSAAVVISRYGGGKVITMTDNPNFRAFWYGTNKLFANAIFFGQTISGSTAN
tara:strand:+ start:28921 stop:31509 length:2589 start_codon:yes stop_codon:yes gene_type:complete